MSAHVLDLFCGSGGCSVGYARAGFTVFGVDIEPKPDYPYPMLVDDAMSVLSDPDYLDVFDIVHASPPCPVFSSITRPEHRADHKDLLTPTRAALTAWGGLYVIENVPRAPMRDAVLLCGASFGLGIVCRDGVRRHLRRHRLFESNMALMSAGCCCPPSQPIGVYGGRGGPGVRPTDGTSRGYQAYADEARRALDVPWMRKHREVTNAVPPVYTQALGEQIMRLVELPERARATA